MPMIAKSYKLIVVMLIFALGFISLPIICSAAAPKFLGKIDVNAPITDIRVTPDGKCTVVMMQSSGRKPAGMQIIDTSHPEKPVIKGILEVSGELFLSPDGRHALIMNKLEQEKYDNPTRHEIINVDILNSDKPKVKWRREISARKVAIADDASAYAFSIPSPKKTKLGQEQTWQTVVSWIGSNRQDAVVDEGLYTNDDEMHFSDRAGFLLFPQRGTCIRLFDLRSKKPVLYEQSCAFLQRYIRLLGFMEDGHIIVKDARTPRISVYAPYKGIPRIATMAYDIDENCSKLNINGTGSVLILRNNYAKGRVERINIRNIEKLLFDSWQLPLATYPSAATEKYLFAAGGNRSSEMLIFRLDVSVPAAVNWTALEVRHRDIINQYNKDIRKKDLSPYFKAVESLEEAGILQALDAPVEGISNKEAAVILNDYGFLASKRDSQSKLAENALRRAIALDPERAVARLNLGDLLRERLSSLTNFSAKQKQLLEIKDLYQKYIDLGGKRSARIASILKEEPDRIAGGNICKAIAGYANAGRLNELVTQSAFNIKVGTDNLDLIFTTEGTARVPTMYAFDAKTDFPSENDGIETPGDENLWGGDELGLVVYGNATHILHYRDFRHPVESKALDGNGSCKFKVKTIEKVGPKSIEKNLCHNLIRGKGPSTVKFENPAPIKREDVSRQYAETGAENMRFLDFANDGKPVNIAEMELSSGAGPGCEAWFYETLEKTGHALASGPKHKMLMKLQDADVSSSSRYPVQCGNKPRFFTYQGKIYFENKPAGWPPEDNWNQYHRVARIIEGKVIDVCDFKFETSVIPVP